MSEHQFTNLEKKTLATLATVVGLRMLGLFMVLPILALYTDEFIHATPYLIGLALGIYGFTQAIFQVPFGAASDRWGRRPLIILGLLIFIVGSIIAALSTSIFGIILGRALQGAGTISAVALAMLGERMRESQRPKSMAIIGVTIGMAFTLSLMLGPILDRWIGIQGIFWLAATLAIVGMVVVWTLLPKTTQEPAIGPGRLKEKWPLVFTTRLFILYIGTMATHMVMTALFLAFPLQLIEISAFQRDDLWQVMVPALLISLVVLVPLLRYSSRTKRITGVMLVAGLLLLGAQGVLGYGSIAESVVMLVAGLCLFFMGFNTLEALLPSTTVTRAPENARGTVMGIFNASTFIGAFLGGVFGGLVFTRYEATGVFLFAGIVILIWLAVTVMAQRYLGLKSGRWNHSIN